MIAASSEPGNRRQRAGIDGKWGGLSRIEPAHGPQSDALCTGLQTRMFPVPFS